MSSGTQRDDYKKDSEGRIKEVKVYYNKYIQVRNSLTKERERIMS
jgi:hypothetical protein